MAHERITRRHPDIHAGIDSIEPHHDENSDTTPEVANRRTTRQDHSYTTMSRTSRTLSAPPRTPKQHSRLERVAPRLRDGRPMSVLSSRAPRGDVCECAAARDQVGIGRDLYRAGRAQSVVAETGRARVNSRLACQAQSVRYDDPLRNRFDALQAQSTDPHSRGRGFETIVAEIFDRAGFDVVTNPGAARPRQTDVYASRGSETYLIEAKWRTSPVGSNDVDDVRIRLQRQPGGVVGVLVTMGGVVDEALREIEHHRDTPILVIDDREIEDVLGGTADLRQLLRSKYMQLTVHGRASGSPPRPFVASSRDHREPLLIVRADGAHQPWVAGAGDFHDSVWALEVADIDWTTASGTGVSLDLPIEVDTLDEVRAVCKELVALNWLTHVAAWAIQQSSVTWNGIGRESMLAALSQRDSRYAGFARLHHREVLIVTDACPGGWYTLVADLDARSERAYHVDISLQLIGIPVDPSEIQRLCNRIGVDDAGFFRPRIEKSVESFRVSEPIEVTPTAWIIEHEPADSRNPLWARGITFDNPIGTRDGELSVLLEDNGVVLAHLRSWHPADELPSSYFLERIEWARSSDATVVRAIANWPQDPHVIDHAPLRNDEH